MCWDGAIQLQTLCKQFYRRYKYYCDLCSIDEDELFSEVVLEHYPSVYQKYSDKNNCDIHGLTEEQVYKCIRATLWQRMYNYLEKHCHRKMLLLQGLQRLL